MQHRHPIAFTCGLGILTIALASPLDAMAAHSSAIHMSQHMLLILLAAPLLAVARPLSTSMWALPPRYRLLVGAWWARQRSLRAACDLLSAPLPAWIFASGVLWVWHIPAAYNWALLNDYVHVVEHLSFFVSALMLSHWIVDPSGVRTLGHGTSMLLIAAFSMHGNLLGALLTFAPSPLYVTQRFSLDELSALRDQQLAGLIMWVPAGFLQLGAIAWLGWNWLNAFDQHAKSQAFYGAHRPASPPNIQSGIAMDDYPNDDRE